jgi:hypothetical protein
MNQQNQNTGMAPPLDPSQPGMTAVHTKNTHQFFIKHTIDGQDFEGQFACRRLSIKQLAAVSVRKSQLNGGYYFDEVNPGRGIDEDTDWTNHMMAHLEIALIQAPHWFNLDEIYDVNLLIKIYGEIAKFENSFVSPQQRAAVNPRGSQDDSGSKGEGAGAAGSVAAVGGGQVSPPLDP